MDFKAVPQGRLQGCLCTPKLRCTQEQPECGRLHTTTAAGGTPLLAQEARPGSAAAALPAEPWRTPDTSCYDGHLRPLWCNSRRLRMRVGSTAHLPHTAAAASFPLHPHTPLLAPRATRMHAQTSRVILQSVIWKTFAASHEPPGAPPTQAARCTAARRRDRPPHHKHTGHSHRPIRIKQKLRCMHRACPAFCTTRTNTACLPTARRQWPKRCHSIHTSCTTCTAQRAATAHRTPQKANTALVADTRVSKSA